MRLPHLVRILAAAAFLSCPVPGGAAVSSVAPPCSAHQLTAADAGTKNYSTRSVTKIDVINNSRSTCSLRGYPQLSFLLFSGAPMFVLLNKTAADANYKTPGPTTIGLPSLERASFLLGYPKTKAGRNACVAISNISIVFGPAPRLEAVNVPDTISSCGTVNVSPFYRLRV